MNYLGEECKGKARSTWMKYRASHTGLVRRLALYLEAATLVLPLPLSLPLSLPLPLASPSPTHYSFCPNPSRRHGWRYGRHVELLLLVLLKLHGPWSSGLGAAGLRVPKIEPRLAGLGGGCLKLQASLPPQSPYHLQASLPPQSPYHLQVLPSCTPLREHFCPCTPAPPVLLSGSTPAPVLL